MVHPVPGEAEARGLRLGDLALVVGKLQVNPPGVEVKAFPQVLEAHGRALNVPAGVPLPQGLFQRMMCPGSAAFQRAKSRGSSFSSRTSTRAPALSSSRRFPESFPYSGKERTRK